MEIINTTHIEGNGYADDCSAVAGGPRLDHLVMRMDKMLKKLTDGGALCGLRFNSDKTVAVLFTRKKKIKYKYLKFEGKQLEYESEVKYLGVTLDSKLTWKTHILNKIQQVKNLLAA